MVHFIQLVQNAGIFEPWFLDLNIVMLSPDIFRREPPGYDIMISLNSTFESTGSAEQIDLNILYLHTSKDAFERGDNEIGLQLLSKIQPDKLLNAFRYKNIGWGNGFSLELVGYAVANLTIHDQLNQAYTLVDAFKKEVNRSSILGFASQVIAKSKQHIDKAILLVDSAKVEMNRIENPSDFQPNRHQVAMALMYINPDKYRDESLQIIKNSNGKFEAISRFSESFALNNNLFKSQLQIPALIAAGDEASFLQSSVKGLNIMQSTPAQWEKFRANEFIFVRRFLIYIDENE